MPIRLGVTTRTMPPTQRYTPPRWRIRSAIDHPGQVGTGALRSAAATVSANAAISTSAASQ